MLCAVTLVVCLPCESLAQAAQSEIQITVTDAQTKAPITIAHVALAGPIALSGLTDERGTATFEMVPSGVFNGFVVKSGYRPTVIPNLTVAPSSNVVLSVTLSKALKTIGAVVVRAKPRFTVNSVSANGASSVASGSLDNSLQLLPQLQMQSDSGGRQTASIGGHDASETAIYADGAPIAPIGTALNLRDLDLDLFDSSSANAAGGLTAGGALDFHIPDPTIAYSFSGYGSYASHDNNGTTFFARGTAGYIGFSLGHAERSTVNPVDGQVYRDQSGFTYRHDAAQRATTDVLKVRLPLSTGNAVNVLALKSHAATPDYCAVFAGFDPCGYGLRNYSNQDLSSFQLQDSAFIGKVSLSVTGFSSVLSGADNRLHWYVNGKLNPLYGRFSARTNGVTLQAQLYGSARNRLSVSGTTFSTTTSGSAQIGIRSGRSPQIGNRFGQIAVTDDVQLTPHLRYDLQIGANGATGTAGSPLGTLSFLWAPNATDRFTGSYEAGELSVAPTVDSGFSLPQMLQFNCQEGTAFGAGPSQLLRPSESSTATAEFEHRAASVDVVVNAYRQVLNNAPLEARLSGSAFPVSLYPPGYFGAISQFAATPAGCGRPLAIAPNDLALLSYVSGRAIYEGATAGAQFALPGGFQIQPSYTVTAARDVSSSPMLMGSTIRPNQQLPGVPPHQAALTVDWRDRSGALEAAATYSYTSGNNANALPAYSLVNLGAVLHLEHGELVASAFNVFNQQAALFGSPKGAQPIPRNGLPALIPIALPLQPRTLQLAYRITVGAPLKPPTIPNAPNQPTSSVFTAVPFPARQPADPYAINTDNPQCGPERAAPARQVFDAFRKYVASGRYVPREQLPLGEWAILRKTPSGGAAFLIGGSEPQIEAAVVSCASVSAGTTNEAARHDAYAPTTAESNLYDLLFARGVGFYITFDQKAVVHRNVTLLPLPSVPPTHPFSLNGSSACSSDLKGAARYVLGALQSYFAAIRSGRMPPPVDGVTVVPRRSPMTWYQLHFDDPSIQDALSVCGNVHSASETALHARGISGAPGQLNYAPAIGLYELGTP